MDASSTAELYRQVFLSCCDPGTRDVLNCGEALSTGCVDPLLEDNITSEIGKFISFAVIACHEVTGRCDLEAVVEHVRSRTGRDVSKLLVEAERLWRETQFGGGA